MTYDKEAEMATRDKERAELAVYLWENYIECEITLLSCDWLRNKPADQRCVDPTTHHQSTL